MNSSFRLLLAGLALSGLTSCSKNAAIKQENQEIMQRVNELQTQLRQVEAETATFSALGQYNITQPVHLDGFKGQIEVSKVRVQTLREELEEAKKEVADAQQQFNDYKDRHRTL